MWTTMRGIKYDGSTFTDVLLFMGYILFEYCHPPVSYLGEAAKHRYDGNIYLLSRNRRLIEIVQSTRVGSYAMHSRYHRSASSTSEVKYW